VDFTDSTHQAEHTRTAAEQREADVRASELGVPFEPRGRLVIGRCRLAGCSPAPVTLRPTVTAVPAPVGMANALLPPKSSSLASKATRGVVTACHQAATERHSRSTGGANPRRKYSAFRTALSGNAFGSSEIHLR
jgi:hypothetical protein